MGAASRRKHQRRVAGQIASQTDRPSQSLEPVVNGDRSMRIHGSDQKALIVRPCQLCGEIDRLLLGHVAPRWSALWTKREGHVVGGYSSLGVETKTQDYPKHYFFCSTCEQRLGEAENYLSRITRGTADDLARVGATVRLMGWVPRLGNIDEVLLFRGLAGIALKLHLSPHSLFRRWSLSAGEANELRRALLSDSYPRARFAVFAEKFFSRLIPGANPRTSLYLYFSRRHGGVTAHLNFAGMGWALFLGPAERLRDEFREVSMPLIFESGAPWSINPSEWAANPTVMHGNPVELDHLVDGAPIASRDECPCGLGLAFSHCCADRWLPSTATRLELAGAGSPPTHSTA